MRIMTVLSLLAMVLAVPAASLADVYPLKPDPVNMWDLDHNRYYTWGIQWSLPDGEELVGVTLEIDNINNWRVEPNIMYIHLLDSANLGVSQFWDSQNPSNAFTGHGILLTTYVDDDLGPNPPEDFSYSLTDAQLDTFADYADDGLVGLGFDPDCHYWNDGVKLTIETAEVPVPGAALLAGLGLGVVNLLRRRVA